MTEELKLLIQEVSSDLNKIKNSINENSFDSKVQYLNSYAVIRASGSLERILKTIIYNKLTENVSAETNQYISKMILESSFNPTTGKIINILQDISSDWTNQFKNYIEENTKKKGDLNSLIQARNSFSHGNSINLSIGDIITYFESGVDIMSELDIILK